MYRKLLKILENKDAFLITSPHELRYFTGFSGGEGMAVIGKDFRILITDSRYIEAAAKEAEEFETIEASLYYMQLNGILSDRGIKRIFYNDSHMTVKELSRINSALKGAFELIPAADSLEKMRMIKTEYELECIRTAEEIGSAAFEYVLGKIRENMTELELAAEIEYFMKKSGAQKTSFDTIAVSGKKTSMPHGVPDDKKISLGDFITMDFGCVYKGYCSDMTRTVVLGKADKKQKEIYNIVLNAQLAALEFMEAGKSAKAADRVARDIIEKAGYGKFFGHSLGHGVGLLIHELPNLSPKSDCVLEENMVVSCEPGIYLPGFGGVRIEDLVVIKHGGIENLTSADKKFTEI